MDSSLYRSPALRTQSRVGKISSPHFQDHSHNELFALNFHLPDHVTGDLRRLGSMKMLKTSSFERYNIVISHVHSLTSQRFISVKLRWRG